MSYNLKNTSKLPSFDPYQASRRSENRTGHMEKRGPAVYTPNLNCRIKKQIAEPFSLKLYSQGGKLKEEDRFYGNVKQNKSLDNLLHNQKQNVQMENQNHNIKHIKKEKKLSDLMALYFKGELEKRSQDSATKYLRSQMTPLEREVFDNSEVDKFRYMKHMVGTNEVALNHYRTKQAVMDHFSVQNPSAKRNEENVILKDIAEGMKKLNKKGESVPVDTEERDHGATSAPISMDLERTTTGIIPSAVETIASNNPDAIGRLISQSEEEANELSFGIAPVFSDFDNLITMDENYQALRNGFEYIKRWGYDADQVDEDQIEEMRELISRLAQNQDAKPQEVLKILFDNLGIREGLRRSWMYHLFPTNNSDTSTLSGYDPATVSTATKKIPDFSRDYGRITSASDPGNIGLDLNLLSTGREIALRGGLDEWNQDGREAMSGDISDIDMDESPTTRGRGRPKGSKNQPSTSTSKDFDKFSQPSPSQSYADRFISAISFSPTARPLQDGRWAYRINP